VYAKKVPLKNKLCFGKYKKTNFLYFPKYKVFFNGTFLRMLLLYISFYIFTVIISGDIKCEILNFSKIRK
jgi:hypothetical protein